MLFKEKMRNPDKIYLKQSELDRREWKKQNADIALSETGMQLQSQRMELHQANHLTDQTRREQSWLCDESEMQQKKDKKLNMYKEFDVQKMKELDN